MPYMKGKKQITAALSPELIEELDAMAARQGLSRRAAVEVMIAGAVLTDAAHHDEDPPPGARAAFEETVQRIAGVERLMALARESSRGTGEGER